jgi:hypothetical protein
MKPKYFEDENFINSYIESNNICKTERNNKSNLTSTILENPSFPLDYKFTSLRKIHKNRRNNFRFFIDSFNKDKISSRNYKSNLINFPSYNPSTNISSYIHLNKSTNSNNNNNNSNYNNNSINYNKNNESNTISTSPSYLKELPQILDMTSKKYINKQNYGKLLLFNNNFREERYQNYLNKVLSDEYYFYKENKGLKPLQFNVTMYGRNISEKYFNLYIDSFNKYYRIIINATDKEKDNNEKLILQKNYLKTEINRLIQKKQKLLDKFLSYLSIKKFLLHVKNKTLDVNNFKLEDLRQYLKDEERKELVLNDYQEKKERKSTLKKSIKRISNAKKLFRMSIKFNQRNTITSFDQYKKGITPDKNKTKNIIKNTENNYFPIINNPIFKSVLEFENVFELLNDELAKYLTIYNNIRKEITPLIIKKNNLSNEILIEEEKKNKLIKEELKYLINKLNLEKNKYDELIKQKEFIIKDEININKIKMENIIYKKIENIMNNINKYYKKYDISRKLEIKNNNPSLVRLEVIEIVINILLNEKKIFVNQYPKEYKELIIDLNLKEKLENIEKRKRADLEKQNQLYEKVIAHKNKVYIIPTHKVFDKYDLSKLKKIEK